MSARDRMRKTAHLHYTTHHIPERKQQKASMFLMGNQGRIFGMRDDDYNSNDMLLNEVEPKKPNVKLTLFFNHIDNYIGVNGIY